MPKKHLNIFFNFVNNIVIRLIIVEPRVIIDLFKFIIIRTKIYNGVYFIYHYMSAIRIYYLYASYNFFIFIYG